MLSLSDIRSCFEGAIPSVLATCAADGTPNVAYLSQVNYVDDEHVALTYQFFNTTRRNILANPLATLQVIDPDTAAHYRLRLQYLRTETEGPLFERMKAKLAGIASHTGMSNVFRLLGSDVYRVLGLDHVSGPEPLTAGTRRRLLPALRNGTAVLSGCTDLAHLFDTALLVLETDLGIGHSMLLMYEEGFDRLYTVATRGYPRSGVGSEIGIGDGIIGVAARERTPIRIGYAAHEYLYTRAAREGFTGGEGLGTEIPFPGLADSGSQLAVPLVAGSRLLGVLYAESPQALRFTYEDEDALVVLAGHLALATELLSQTEEQHAEVARGPGRTPVTGRTLAIRYFTCDHSVFIDNDYLIKGVAGAIIWRLLCDHVESGRTEFTNRELRLDPNLRLPDVCDNLEARLILLQRRLAERCAHLAIEKTGRGRFRLRVSRPLQLDAVSAC